MSTKSCDIQVEKIQKSKIDQVDFENLAFGEVFTDHMLVCDFKNGAWEQPKIMPYGPMSIEPSARVFHYGQAIFEGMKAYKDDQGGIALFRPKDNFIRFNKSCERMAIPEVPEDYFFEGLKTLIQLDAAWVQPGVGNSLYLRPFAIASQPGIIASPSTEYKFIIICSPAQAYYGGEVRVKIAEKYSRAANGGFGYAKAAGNYAGQFYPTNLAKKEGFQQIIWTDASTHEYIEEAGTMNVFVRIGNTLVTGPTSDRILDGVTRKSVITMAKEMGIKVEVRPIKVAEIIAAVKNGSLKELFGSGTAAVISPIVGFGYQGKTYELPIPEDAYSTKIKKALLDIQYNRAEDPHGWRYSIV